jgi:putative endonuclease
MQEFNKKRNFNLLFTIFMAQHNELGKEGEEMGVAWLREKGYKILHCNWRFSRYEIDIIATKDDRLHFVEVKTLKGPVAGHPEDSVTKKKFRKLVQAAEEFLYRHPQYQDARFNVLSITTYAHKKPEFFLIEDVFL